MFVNRYGLLLYKMTKWFAFQLLVSLTKQDLSLKYLSNVEFSASISSPVCVVERIVTRKHDHRANFQQVTFFSILFMNVIMIVHSL